jgi:hypothetical protein
MSHFFELLFLICKKEVTVVPVPYGYCGDCVREGGNEQVT